MNDENNNPGKDLEKILSGGKAPCVIRAIMNILSGVVPLAGGVICAGAGAWSEKEQERINKLFETWLKIQAEEIEQIGKTLAEVFCRIDLNDEIIEKRISSPEYLSLIKQIFRDWSAGVSEKKRVYLRNLLANAAECRLATDSVVSVFIKWIDTFTELHLDVIALIYNDKGITRYDMWQYLYGQKVREDSPEADLFKLVIDDLSMGHVIRQERLVDYHGNFMKSAPRRKSYSITLKSAFDNEKGYELTGMGYQFVHYTMNELVPKIEATI